MSEEELQRIENLRVLTQDYGREQFIQALFHKEQQLSKKEKRWNDLKDELLDLQQENKQLKERIQKAIGLCDNNFKKDVDTGGDYWAGKNNAKIKTSQEIKDILQGKEDK